MRFNRLAHQFWRACCCVASCVRCSSSTPSTIKLIIPAGEFNNQQCSNCSNINGTKILTFDSSIVGSDCGWSLTSNNCSSDYAQGEYYDVSLNLTGGNVIMQVSVVLYDECSAGTSGLSVLYQKTFSSVTQIDCTSLSETVSYSSASAQEGCSQPQQCNTPFSSYTSVTVQNV